MVNTTPLYERPTNVTGFNDFFFTYANNTLFPGVWSEMILVIVFSITFLSLMDFGIRRPFAASTFLTWVTSVFLFVIGIAGSIEVTVTGIIFLVSLLINRQDTRAI